MNTVVTSKEEILEASRELIRQQGWASVNIRSVATACGVSVGSIYNYFASKADLIGETVESVWCEIFHISDDPVAFRDTLACVAWMYERIRYGCERYPGFFTLHSLGFMSEDKADGRQRMRQACQHMVDGLCAVLRHDPNVRADAFGERLTVEQFADALFSLVFSALLRQDHDSSAVLEIVRRTLY